MNKQVDSNKVDIICKYFEEKQILDQDKLVDTKTIDHLYDFLVNNNVPPTLNGYEILFLTIYYLLDNNMVEAEKYNNLLIKLGYMEGVYLIGKKYLQIKEEDNGIKYLHAAIENSHIGAMECLSLYYLITKQYDKLYNLYDYAKNISHIEIIDNTIKKIPVFGITRKNIKHPKRRSYEVIWTNKKRARN